MNDSDLGYYVYGVVTAEEQLALTDVDGVDPPSPVETRKHRGLAALVTRVKLQEFGEEALKRNLEDIGWLERTARAHDRVLARALAGDGVVPLRLCTVFTEDSHLHEMLEREHRHLLEALERLRGHAEWSVKALADPQRLEVAVRERASMAAGGAERELQQAPGRAYFARKKADRVLSEDAHAMVQTAAQEAHASLHDAATAATVLPLQRRELSGRRGDMVLNGAYLVHRSKEGAFAAAVDELHARHRDGPLDFELSGPWAPYNFVEPREELASAAIRADG